MSEAIPSATRLWEVGKVLSDLEGLRNLIIEPIVKRYKAICFYVVKDPKKLKKW